MVWQRFAKPSCNARAGSSPAASANPQSQIGNRRTCSSAEIERDSAKVEVARSNRARSTKR